MGRLRPPHPGPAGGASCPPALGQHHPAGAAGPVGGKGYVSREKQGKGYLYAAALAREDYLPVESRSALERMFGGSAKNLIAAMAQTKDLSKEDIDELAAYLEELKQGGR